MPALPPGLVAPILTPFEDDGTIAHDLLAAHAGALLDAGCAGLAPFGTTGEALSISAEERVGALERLVAEGIPTERMVPGTGLCSLPETIGLSRACQRLGCAGAMVLPPFYYKDVAEEGLFRWYAALIEAVPGLEVTLYHIPQVAGVGLPIPLVRRLREAFPEAVVAIKDSSGDAANLAALQSIEGLSVYPSSETALAEAMRKGAPGCITASANLNAAAIVRYIEALRAGDDAQASAMAPEIARVREASAAAGFIAAPKRVLAIRHDEPRWANVRPPFVEATEAEGRALDAALGGSS